MRGERKIRTRFAPSPTGYLHIGNARTALFNFLFARHHNGSFILRIEDTDRQRSTLEFEKSIFKNLKWLGIDWDKSPGAEYLYRQSERLDIYFNLAEKLLKEGKAYRCYCTEERLHELRKKQMSMGMPPRYDGKCRSLAEEAKDTHYVVRFRVPEKTIILEDMVHKKIIFDSRLFGDFIIINSDGIATYNFAAVIDDSMMEITHVIRGDDHLPNTPRQILLFEALGLKLPKYAHIPLILGNDSSPISKRHGSASIMELQAEGFLPEAIINHLCHLGWSPGREFFSIKEAIEMFSIEKLSRSPSVFDIERLRKFNIKYIEKSDTDELIRMSRHYFSKDIPEERLKTLIEASKSEVTTLRDLPHILKPFLKEPVIEEDAMKVIAEPCAKKVLEALMEEVVEETSLTDSVYPDIIKRLKGMTGEKGKNLFMPIRAALTGMTKGLGLEKVFHLLGKEEVLKRVRKALAINTFFLP
ncbi:MAG TPA: glutamate--tRNA ligase [Deltaproteobacteria bacterium]|nr:glutamate--tRNA ligase [Deltaproteobacteria bacterium]